MSWIRLCEREISTKFRPDKHVFMKSSLCKGENKWMDRWNPFFLIDCSAVTSICISKTSLIFSLAVKLEANSLSESSWFQHGFRSTAERSADTRHLKTTAEAYCEFVLDRNCWNCLFNMQLFLIQRIIGQLFFIFVFRYRFLLLVYYFMVIGIRWRKMIGG